MSDLVYGNRMELINSPDDIIGELNEYRKLGTVEEVKEAIGKQSKQEVIWNGKYHYCPSCKGNVYLGNFCNWCGQRLDWS